MEKITSGISSGRLGGDRIAYISTPSPRLAEQRGPNHLFMAAIDGVGQLAEYSLLFTFPSTISSPRWSRRRRRPLPSCSAGRVTTVDQIHLAATDNGSYGLLTEGYQGSISKMKWTDTGRLTFVALENLFGAVNRLDVKSKEIKPAPAGAGIKRGAFGGDFDVGPNDTVAAVWSDATHPGEVFVTSGRDGTTTNQSRQPEPRGSLIPAGFGYLMAGIG